MARKRELKPRKQPRQARATATVAAILDATAEAIAQHGFERANVNEIAERAGVSIGSLYQYFPNKEALLVQLIEHHTNAAMDSLDDALARVAEAPLDAAVREVIGVMVDVHRGRLNRTLALELDDIGRLEELERAVDERAGKSVVAFISARRPEIRVPDPELAAFLLIRLVDQLTHAALRDRPETVESGALTEELTHLTLGYLERARDRR